MQVEQFKYYLIFFCILVMQRMGGAQSFYYCTSEITNPDGGVEIGVFDTNDCSSEYYTGNEFFDFTDITFHSDSSLNCFRPFGYNIDTENNIGEVFTDPVLYLMLKGQIQDEVTALTCDQQGNIYAAGTQLHTWNDYQITYLGDLPPNMHARGDLTYRHGKLYLSTIQNTLVEVDINNPMNSSVVMTFPAGTPPIHGLATVAVTCDSVVTYAAGGLPFGESTIYEVDFENLTLIPICTMDAYIVGLAALDECTLPPCTLSVDLDADNSTAMEFDYTSNTICAFPTQITDTDVELISELEAIDSIILILSNTQSAQEYLSLDNFTSLTIEGNNTLQLKLSNNGTSSLINFSQALTEIQYFNDAIAPSYGLRTVTIRAYYGAYLSAPAHAFLNIAPSPVQLSFTSESVSCYGNMDGQVIPNATAASPPLSYLWNTGANTDTLENLSAGDYQVTLTDALGCTAMGNASVSEPDSLEVEIVYNGPSTLCENIGVLDAIATGGTGTYHYSWSNGNETIQNLNIGAGLHDLTLTDDIGCMTTASLFIEAGEDVFIDIMTPHCFGDTIFFEGNPYWSDTTLILNYPLLGGCDSIVNYTLDFTEPNITTIEAIICLGDTLYWNGEIFTAATNLLMNYAAANGCDSLIVFELSLFETPVVSIFAEGNLCEAENILLSTQDFSEYLWSTGENEATISITETGVYRLTVTDSNNCQTSVNYEVQQSPIDSIHFQIIGQNLQIDSISGGTAPFRFALNNSPSQSQAQFNDLPSGTHQFHVEDANGCTAQATFRIQATEEDLIFIPNIFSPNDDGHNDIFTVYTDPSIQSISLIQVYTRWGDLMYQGRDVVSSNGEGWNGKIKGEDAASGVYVYRVVLFLNGKKKAFRGDVMLVR